MDKREKWQEIANRGLQDRFDPETRAKFDEAVNRGLITLPKQGFTDEQKQSMRKADEELYSPTSGMSRLGKFAAGVDKYFSEDLPSGVKQLAFDYMDTSGGIPFGLSDSYVQPPKFSRDAIETGQKQINEKIAQTNQRDEPLKSDPYGATGNVLAEASAFLPTAAIPGVNTYTGAGLVGALMSGVSPVEEGEDRLTNIVKGGAAGVVGQGMAKGVAKVLDPAIDKSVSTLKSAGVELTPGQAMQGAWRAAEDKLMSVPILGGFIRNARNRGVQSFNKAVANKVLEPLKSSVDDGVEVGQPLFRHVDDKISQAYDDSIKSIDVAMDGEFASDMTKINAMVKSLPDDLQKQFNRFLEREVKPRVGTGKFTGEAWKEMHSEAGKYSRGITRGKNALNDDLADAYREVRESLFRLLERSNPRSAMGVREADQAYSMLKIMEDAATRAGSKEGVMTPAQLAAAVRKAGNNKSLAKGNAVLQDMADPARTVIDGGVPNSGTADRWLMAALGGGAVYDPTFVLPAVAAGSGAGALTYSQGGNKLVNALLTERPEAVRALGSLIRSGSMPAALTASSASRR